MRTYFYFVALACPVCSPQSIISIHVELCNVVSLCQRTYVYRKPSMRLKVKVLIDLVKTGLEAGLWGRLVFETYF